MGLWLNENPKDDFGLPVNTDLNDYQAKWLLRSDISNKQNEAELEKSLWIL